jgi:hypothetical protein
MKPVIERLLEAGDKKKNNLQLSTTLYMILIFLAFWGVSFYVLLNSLA